MIYLIFIILIMSIIVLINHEKNATVYKFLFIIYSFLLFVITFLFRVAKSFNYQYPATLIYNIDYKIYILLSEVKINYYLLLSIFQLAIVLYIVAVTVFTVNCISKHKRTLCVLTVLLCSIYTISMSPYLNMEIYRKLALLTDYKELLFQTWNFIRNGIILLCVLLLLTNNYILLKTQITAKTWLRKLRLITFNVYITCLNFIVEIVLLRMTLWSLDIWEISGVLLYSNNSSYTMNFSEYVIFGVTTLSVTIVMIFSIFRYKVFGMYSRLHNYIENRRIRKHQSNIMIYFHSLKNILLTFSILAEMCENESYEKKDEVLSEIKKISRNELNSISKMLNQFKYLEINVDDNDISECIKSAIEKTHFKSNISVKVNCEPEIKAFKFDFYHMEEVFKNIFNNAIEAIFLSKVENGIISVLVRRDNDIVEISISDNGCGMDKKTARHMFKPLYTTKSKNENWGMGMYYSNRIIAMHGGFVRLSSKRRDGTMISVFVPYAV